MKKQQVDVLSRWEGPLAHPFYSKFLKRFLDFSFALMLLPLALIIMIPISVWIKLDSEGPVFYSAPRSGYQNLPFNIIKFRTMVNDADKFSGITALNDDRVTCAGYYLRKSKLDEIPQIFNILKGEMSFVGPRPELPKYTSIYKKEQQQILWVRPGVTDASSIFYIDLDERVGESDPEKNYEATVFDHKNKLRLEYAQNQSFLLDAKLFLQTIWQVLKRIFIFENKNT